MVDVFPTIRFGLKVLAIAALAVSAPTSGAVPEGFTLGATMTSPTLLHDAPESVEVTWRHGSATVSWPNVEGASHYRLERERMRANRFGSRVSQPIWHDRVEIGPLTGTSYIDTDVDPNETYRYRVSAGGNDPGPPGAFSWKGLNWDVRTHGGAPMHNGQWSGANISGPDSDGAMRLRITNDTGTSPVGAEFRTTRRSFGYGTYTSVVTTGLDDLPKPVVFGGLFTFDDLVGPPYNEIDVHEASAWGGGVDQDFPVAVGHSLHYLNDGEPTSVAEHYDATDGPETHVLVWEPGQLTFTSYQGRGTGGPVLKHTTYTGHVPEPAQERLHYNLWVIDANHGDADGVPLTEVVVEDFSFVPADLSTLAWSGWSGWAQ